MKGLVLDDDHEVCAYIASVMEEMGITPLAFQDPVEALAKTEKQDIDLAFIDINLPRMDGLHFCERFKKSFPEADIVFMTGYGDYDKAVQAIKLGTYDFLKKPFRRLDIHMCLSRLTEKRLLYEKQKRMDLLEFSNKISLQLMHEIRNPLAAIGGFARLLSRKQMHEKKLRETSAIIYNSAVRLENVLKEILAYLKMGPQFGENGSEPPPVRGKGGKKKKRNIQPSERAVPKNDGNRHEKGHQAFPKAERRNAEKGRSKSSPGKTLSVDSGINKEYLSSKRLCRVTFRLPHSAVQKAKRVNIVGDFNNWNRQANPMEKSRDGDYVINLELRPGRDYQFRYLIDGTTWENDWDADGYIPSPYGDSENSIVSI